MSVSLTTTSGPHPTTVLQLHTESVTLVGRGEGNDASFPDDFQMSTRHFTIEVRPHEALLTDLDSTNGTYVNGERIREAIVSSGDEIFAGQTTFLVGDGDATSEVSANADNVPLKEVSFDTSSVEVCDGMSLTDEALPLLTEAQTVAQFVHILKKNSLYMDALRVLSRAMGTNAAVQWSCQSVLEIQRDNLSEMELQTINAAAACAANPSEKLAIEAHSAAAQLGHEGAAAMLALAAYWGTGNMAPPGHPPMPVDKQLPSQAIAGALTLVAVNGPPKEAARKYEEFIKRALSSTEK
ncbi:FHA domain-containing protein [Planctomicrobium sp.]|jgi:pSer/pThr/pTyr-binding forkhead associated (FHA) protein|nr:FHA domain-containing protein [Planctomicrobium sp.]MBT5018702.1 FHA domain-containing protein [Planctomicrobium sp.]MDB4732832.1 FHA domain-containing protein [Planctomicrobium sp.]MDB4802689.1 FHA domain-containing protein [bacterium]